MQISFILNHRPITVDTDPTRRLLDVLREDLHLTGTKEGCGEGECGSCTVLLDGKAIHACLVMVGQAAEHEIVTIEGLQQHGKPDPLQQAFVDHGAIQCGFCTPGMILSAKALLLENPHPTEDDIRRALDGNICRCSNYSQIVKAIRQAAGEVDA